MTIVCPAENFAFEVSLNMARPSECFFPQGHDRRDTLYMNDYVILN